MKLKELLRTYLEVMMNKNRIISILLPIMLLASNVPAFGMFSKLAKNCSKTTNPFKFNCHSIFKTGPHKTLKPKAQNSLAKKIAGGTGLLAASTVSNMVEAYEEGTIRPILTYLHDNQPEPENNPYYSTWNPWKWYLGKKHQNNMESLGNVDASQKIQQLFRKALCNSSWQYRWGIRNPDNVPIKELYWWRTYGNMQSTLAYTNSTGIWIDPEFFESNNPLQYIAHHEVGHWIKKHCLRLRYTPNKMLLKLKARLEIEKKIRKKFEREADECAVFTLCNTGQRHIVEEYISNKVPSEEHRNNAKQSLQKWDKLKKQKKKKSCTQVIIKTLIGIMK